jgi:hypothetical protein
MRIHFTGVLWQQAEHREMEQKGRDEKVCSLWLTFTCTEGKLIESVWLYSCPLVLLVKVGWKVDKSVGKWRRYVGGNRNILWFCIRAKMEQLLYLGRIWFRGWVGYVRTKVQIGYQLSACHNNDFGLQGCYSAQRVSEHTTTFQWNLQPSPSTFCKS